MKTVAFLQNQWFPEKHAARIEREMNSCSIDDRAKLAKMYLFFRCLSGRRLRSAFGDTIDEIIWENVSPKIGTTSNSIFPPDIEYMAKIVDHFKPKIVITFGSIAMGGVFLLKTVRPDLKFTDIKCCHPAARHSMVAGELHIAALKVRNLLNDR